MAAAVVKAHQSSKHKSQSLLLEEPDHEDFTSVIPPGRLRKVDVELGLLVNG